MLEEVPTEELQAADTLAQTDRGEKPPQEKPPERQTPPGTTTTTPTSSATISTTATGQPRAGRSQGTAADREHALDARLARRPSALAAVDATDDDEVARDRRGDHRQPRRRRLSDGVGRRDRADGRLVVAGSRARAAHGPALRPGRRRRARSAGVPDAAAAAPRPRRHAGRDHRHRAPAPAAEPSGAGDRPAARHDDRGAEGAHRDHPAPRSEAGQPAQPGAVAVRDPRRLHRQGRGSVRGDAERRRPAAAAHQPGVQAAARQERRRTATRRAPT